MFAMKTALLSGAAAIALTSGAFAQEATSDTDATTGSGTTPLLTDTNDTTVGGDAAVSAGTELDATVAPGDDAEIVTDTDAETDSNVDVAAPGADAQTETDAAAETDMAADPVMEESADPETDLATDAELDAEAAEGEMTAETDAETNTDTNVGGVIGTDTASSSFNFEQAYSGAAGMQIAELIGSDVIDADGKTVGEIDRFARLNNDIVAVIGVGGFLGLGEDDIALSLDQMNYAAEEGQFTLSGYTEEDLEGMPEYDAAAATELENEATLEESWNGL
ncbi:MAG: PRC-barrel domain-containing protein [Celeribacter sp.]|jgi:hypothetical protein